MNKRCPAWSFSVWMLVMCLVCLLRAEPPVSIMLESPLPGTQPFPEPVNLSAFITGYVSKVEFYAGELKVGEASSSLYATQWVPVQPGVYSLTAKALDGVNDPIVSEAVSLELLPQLPYTADFELAEGYFLGAINGQLGWKINAGSAEVVAGGASHGDNKVVIRGGTEACFLHHEFMPSAAQGVCYVDCFVKLAAGQDVDSAAQIDTGASKLACVQTNAGAQLYVWDGPDGQASWIPLGSAYPLDGTTQAMSAWLRVTVRMDYARRRWDVYLQGKMLSHDLCFADDALQQFSTVIFRGAAVGDSELDDLYIGASNPIYTDANNNGVEDAWEQANQLSIERSHPEADADGDHLSDLDEYIHGTNPHLQDTDGDGLWDGVEVFVGSDPCSADISGPKLQVSGAVLHLRADLGIAADATGKMLYWRDVSGNNQVCTIDPNALGPVQVLDSAHGFPVARFHNDNDILRLPDILSGKAAGEIFAAIQFHRRDSVPYAQQLWRFGVADSPSCYFIDTSASSGSSDFGVASSLNWQGPGCAEYERLHLIHAGASDGSSFVRFNGVEEASQSGLGSGFTSAPFLGTYLDGDFAELIVFDRILSNEEREQVTRYLSLKYAPAGLSLLQPPVLSGSLGNANAIDLSWESEANRGQYAAAILERSSGDGQWTPIGTLYGLNSFSDAGLSPGAVYYYRVKLRGLLNTTDYSNVISVVTSTLPALSSDHLRLWLRASAGVHQQDGLVKQWDDMSGRGNHARVNDGSAEPVLVTDGSGLKSMSFSGIGDSFNLPSSVFDGVNAGEVVVLLRLKPITDHFPWNNDVMQFGNGQSTGYYKDQNVFLHYNDFGLDHNEFMDPLPESILSEYHILSSSIDSGNWEERINGMLTGVHTGEGLSFPQSPSIGGNFSGEIVELMVFDHKLTMEERTNLLKLMTYRFPVPSIVPAATPILSGQVVSASQVDLSWTNPYNTQEYAAAELERRTGDGAWAQVASLDNALSYSDLGLTPGTTVSYRVHLENYLGKSDDSNVLSFNLPASGDIPVSGLRIWLRASSVVLDETSNKVLRWKDMSGHGNDACVCSPDGAALHVQEASTGLQYLRFDGSGQTYVLPNALDGLSAGEMFLVSRLRPKRAQLPSNNDVLQFGNGQATGYYIDVEANSHYNDFGLDHNVYPTIQTDAILSDWHIMDCAVGGGSWQERVNGRLTLLTSEPQVSFPSTPMIGNSLDGDLAELLCFDHVLTEQERMDIGAWIKIKYAINSMTPPVAPIVSLSQGAGTSVNVSLILANDLTEYTIKTLERSTDGLNFVKLAEIAPGDTYSDSAVAAGSKYYYRAYAMSSGGNGIYSNVAAITVGNIGPAPSLGNAIWLSSDMSAGYSNAQFVWWSHDQVTHCVQSDQALMPALLQSSEGRAVVHSSATASLVIPGVSMPGDFEVLLLTKTELGVSDFDSNDYLGIDNHGFGYRRTGGVLHAYSPLNSSYDLTISSDSEPELGKLHLLNIVCRQDIVDEYINGVKRASYVRTPDVAGSVLSLFNGRYSGEMNEAVVSPVVFSDESRKALYTYLAARYSSEWSPRSIPSYDSEADSDGDGVSDVVERVNGTDPYDYYNGSTPTLNLMSDASLFFTASGLQSAPVNMQVIGVDGIALNNAPVEIICPSGVSIVTDSGTASKMTLRTNADGSISFNVLISDTTLTTASLTLRAVYGNSAVVKNVTFYKYTVPSDNNDPGTGGGGGSGGGGSGGTGGDGTTSGGTDGSSLAMMFDMAYTTLPEGGLPYMPYGVINMTKLAEISNLQLGSYTGISSDGYVLYGNVGHAIAGEVFSPLTGRFTAVSSVDSGGPLLNEDGPSTPDYFPNEMAVIQKGGLAIGYFNNGYQAWDNHGDPGYIFYQSGSQSDVSGLRPWVSHVYYRLKHVEIQNGVEHDYYAYVDEIPSTWRIYADSGNCLVKYFEQVEIPSFFKIKQLDYSKMWFSPLPIRAPSPQVYIYDGNPIPTLDSLSNKLKYNCDIVTTAGDMSSYIVSQDRGGIEAHFAVSGSDSSTVGKWIPLQYKASGLMYANSGNYVCAAPNSNAISSVMSPATIFRASDVSSTGFEQITPGGLLAGHDANNILSVYQLSQGRFLKFQVNVMLSDGDLSFNRQPYINSKWNVEHWISDKGWIAGWVSQGSSGYQALAIPMGIFADISGDGLITLEDQVTKRNPFPMWINNNFDLADSDASEADATLTPNCDDDHVNGTLDLFDFFPIYLNIKQLLSALPPSASGLQYKLKQADGAVNFVYTNLTRAQAFDFQRKALTSGFGVDFTQAPGSASTVHVTSEGVVLSQAFLSAAKSSGGGVLLLEGTKASTKPLILSVEKNGVVVCEIALELAIGSNAAPAVGLYVDNNRDGEISTSGTSSSTDSSALSVSRGETVRSRTRALSDSASTSDRTTSSKPFRFWINDDNDDGDLAGDDIPLGVGVAGRNCDDDHVNGTRDLVDFFPVYFDLKQLLSQLPPTSGVKYKLKQANGAVNFVYTNRTRAQAFDYQKQILLDGFGPDFKQAASVATVQNVSADGVELSAEFLNLVQNNNGGVILVECCKATTEPLVLSVEKDGSVIVELKLELSISSVDDMFRHVDLTGVPKAYDGSALTLPRMPQTYPAPRTEPANYPDCLTNGKYFVFVHGYNVDADKARGWNAEVFKRLYVVGSRAAFVGLNWHGATGLDYHKAVYNAFQTGDRLATALNDFIPNGADVTVAAHSLGNMVVSHAIQSGGFTPSRYYMINAAVPIEAYIPDDVTVNQVEEMTELAWKSYDKRLYSANWHNLFQGSDDTRLELTWNGRFKGVVSKAYNFYSPGEDVVANASDVTSASVLSELIDNGLDSLLNGTNSWKLQELAKGVSFVSSAASMAFERRQGGWGFNEAWDVLDYPSGSPSHAGPPMLHIREPGQTASILSDVTVLKCRPFCRLFLEADLVSTDASAASAKAGVTKVQYDLLARAIPAMSNAAAANKLPSLGEDHNINMPVDGVSRDPSTQVTLLLPNGSGKWRHSDMKVIALPYIYPLYAKMIAIGGLK